MKIKLLVAASAAAFVFGASAQADTHVLDYTATDGSSNNAQLVVTTSNTLNAIGGYDITGVSGKVDGQTVTGLIPNANQPGTSTSPDGRWYYDNVIFASNPAFDLGGVLFTSDPGSGALEWNLYGNGPGSYSLWSWDGSSYAVQSSGILSSVPEPATWAMMILGVAMIGFAARRRTAGAALAA